jgi:enoyl reductase-like protein
MMNATHALLLLNGYQAQHQTLAETFATHHAILAQDQVILNVLHAHPQAGYQELHQMSAEMFVMLHAPHAQDRLPMIVNLALLD